MGVKVGLTGNIGSGKSTVAKMFRGFGAEVYDADKMVHGYYGQSHPVYRQVVEEFGSNILDERGDINRVSLADIVFNDFSKLELLQEITHLQVKKDIEYLSEGDLVFFESALIFEKNFQNYFDKIVTVYAPKDVARVRAIGRGSNWEDFERRWDLQMSPEEKASMSNYVIDNSGWEVELYLKALEVFNDIKKYSRKT